MNSLIANFSEKNQEPWAVMLITLSAILYGFLGFFGASLLNLNFAISTMLFWRFMIASGWILVWMMINKPKSNRTSFTAKTKLCLVTSSICYCTACTFYFMASKLIGTGIAMVIYFAYPIFVVIFILLKERQWIDKHTCISLIIVLTGLFLLQGRNEQQFVAKSGILFALASAFFFAIYVYISKIISSKISSHLNTFLLCLSNAILFLIYSLITHTFAIPSSFKSWLFTIGLGIIATALPIQLMLEGLKTISATKASILSSLEPTVTLFVGMLLLGEDVTRLQILGAFIILFSALYLQFPNRKL